MLADSKDGASVAVRKKSKLNKIKGQTFSWV